MSTISDLQVQSSANDIPLSKSAITFNKLLKQLEKGEQNLAKKRSLLDQKLHQCLSIAQPVYTKNCEVKIELIGLMIGFLSTHKMTENQETTLLMFCHELCGEILQSPHHLSPEMESKLFEHYESLTKMIDEDIHAELFPEGWMDDDGEDESITDNDTEEFDAFIEYITGVFNGYGLKVDLTDLNSDMSMEEMNARIEKKLKEAQNLRSEGNKKSRKKTAAQIKKEQAAELHEKLKDKKFSEVYKNLVKQLHPDGELDPVLHQKKLEWMKRLTVAYKNKDLKTLLLIELEWLNASQTDLDQLSEEKMDFFNAMLREQVKEVNQQSAELIYDRSYDILEFHVKGRLSMHLANIEVAKIKYEMEISDNLELCAVLNGPTVKAKSRLKQMVKDIMKEQREMDRFFDRMYLK